MPVPRFLTFLLIGSALLFIQVHPDLPFAGSGARPDLLFVVVLYLGIAAPTGRGACLCWALGYMVESFSGVNGGLWQIIYLSVFCAIRLLKKVFNFVTWLSVLILFLACQLLKLCLLLFSFYYVYEYRYSAFVRTGALETLFTLLLFPVVYGLLKRSAGVQKEISFVQQTFKHGRRVR